MVKEAQPIAQAIRASGMTKAAVASILGMSVPTLNDREENPDKFTIGEFFALYYEMDDFSANRMWDYLEGKKASKELFLAQAM